MVNLISFHELMNNISRLCLGQEKIEFVREKNSTFRLSHKVTTCKHLNLKVEHYSYKKSR